MFMEFKTALYHFCRKYGVIGLYKGMEAKLLQTILTAALMFAAYEKIANFVFRILLNRQKMSSKMH
jgi:adenine nucleotide transporter 17